MDYLQELKNVVFCITDLSRCYEAASDVDNVTSHGSFCLRNADKIFFSLQCRNGNRQEKANEQWGFTCGGFFCCFFLFSVRGDGDFAFNPSSSHFFCFVSVPPQSH